MAEQTSRGEKSFPENRREQNRHIRAILSEAFHSSGLTKHQLHEAINKESGFEISYNTLAPIIESPTEDGYDLDKTINLYAPLYSLSSSTNMITFFFEVKRVVPERRGGVYSMG